MPPQKNRKLVSPATPNKLAPIKGAAVEEFIDLAREEKRKGVILTCKEEKIPYYAKFGFVNEGESESDHGGAKWYQMRIVF